VANPSKNLDRKTTLYKRLPRILRYPLVGLAFLLLPLGIISMFTPLAVLEVGSILIFISLTILSFEFDWAHRLLTTFRHTLKNRKNRKRLSLFTIIIIVIYIAIIILRLVAQ